MPGRGHKSEKLVAGLSKVAYLVRSFGRLFWGEQPPFMSFGTWGAVLFCPDRMTADPPERRQPFSCGLMILLSVIIIAALLAFVFWRMETWPMRKARQGAVELEQLARKAREAFVELAQLQPRVTIHDRVYFEQTTGVAELALLSRQTEVDHEFMHTWAGSTKRIKLHGTFNVKAGFNLQQNLAVDVRDDQIVVTIPHASILSVEQQQVDVLEFENGFWNRISAADLEKELGAMPKLAREKAMQSDVLAEAELALQKHLEQRLGTTRPVHLMFAAAPVKKP